MTLDDLELPDNVFWLDEFRFNQVEQSTERSLTGGLIIQHGVKKFGRPITLEYWLARQDLDALYAKEATASEAMALVMPDGRGFDVAFDRSRGLAVDAEQVTPYTYASNQPDWPYLVTLRLLTVEPTGV